MFGRSKSLAVLASGLAAVAASAGTAAAAPGSWTVVPTPAVANGSLNGVDARTASDAWAVGSQLTSPRTGSGFIDHWNGTAWQSSPVPSVMSQGVLNAVSASSASDAWAVGYTRPARYTSYAVGLHWNGSAWSAFFLPGTTGHGYMTRVTDLAPDNAWAVGEEVSLASGLLEHWDGSSWTRLSTPEPNPAFPGMNTTLSALGASSADDVWAVGTYLQDFPDGRFRTETYALHWDGTSFKIVRMPFAPVDSQGTAFTVYSLVALSPSNVWAVGNVGPVGASSGTLIEHFDGTAWSIIPSPSPSFQPVLTGVTARAGNDLWAVGSTLSAPAFGPRLPITLHWDGSTWSLVPTPAVNGATALHSVSTRVGASLIWAVGSSGDSTTEPLALQRS